MIHHSIPLESVLKEVKSNANGLTAVEAEERLKINGANALTQAKKKSMISRFFDQLKNLMIIVLIVAAVISAVVSIIERQYAELIDAGIIFLIVILNAIIGMVQEGKAEAALDALKNLNKPFAKVVRDGQILKIKSDEIVVGDIIILEAGDIVPADIRLLESASLKIEEAALTGESVPSEKDALISVAELAPLGDRKNMAYSSGVISYGRGRGIVVATGMKTEVGKIATMLNESTNDSTPLQKQLAKTAKSLSIIVLVIAAVIFAASLIRKAPLMEAFMTAVAIAVAAIPEGLPAVVTIVLAIGVQRMSSKKAIVRNLPAVETLGCCEVICSDKTGTLTLNQMTVKELYTFNDGIFLGKKSSLSYDLLVKGMVLCNDTIEEGEKLLGDPTETALVAYAKANAVDTLKLKNEYLRVNEIPFDSVRKLMSTVNENNGVTQAYIKGAPDMLIEKCKFICVNDNIRPLTEKDKETIKNNNHLMAAKALRVLAVAIKQSDLNLETLESGLVFVGLIGMIDPARPEVKDAVAICKKAGMTAIMITGDHIDTASAIAKEIGILNAGDLVISGAELDKLSDSEFKDNLFKYRVYARVSPENKVRIVKAFKSFNIVVAMTGDGVNDAPSIKTADIGIGMGITGTDVSKGAADIVLADDNFATIISAVEEGRKVYSNIKKAVQFLLSANIAEVLCLFIATIFLDVKFLTPVMILWVNLVTDSLPALALGTEVAEKDVMNYPPRKSNSSLFAGKTGVDIAIQGFMQTVIVMTVFVIGNYVLADGVNNHSVAMTMAFITLCFIQLFHAYNLRSQTNSLFNKNIMSNKFLNYSFLIGALLIISVVVIPFMRPIFDTAELSLVEWAICIGAAVMIIPFVEIQKAIERKATKRKQK